MNFYHKKFDYFLFDLDDTLYPEIKYLHEAYFKISQYLEYKTKIDSKIIYDFLVINFKEKGRINLFDRMFLHFDIKPAFLSDILNILRTFESERKIPLYFKIYNILPKVIEQSKKVFVVTNGNVIQQKNKVKNIEWNSLDKDLIFVYANEFEKKPSNKCINYIKKIHSIRTDSTIMIGDSLTDKKFSKNSGISFMFINEFISKYNI